MNRFLEQYGKIMDFIFAWPASAIGAVLFIAGLAVYDGWVFRRRRSGKR